MFSIMRFGQPMKVTNDSVGILPWSMVHGPWSTVFTQDFPVLKILCSLWQVSQSSHRAHITVPWLPSSTRFLDADTNNAY